MDSLVIFFFISSFFFSPSPSGPLNYEQNSPGPQTNLPKDRREAVIPLTWRNHTNSNWDQTHHIQYFEKCFSSSSYLGMDEGQIEMCSAAISFTMSS